MLGIVFATAEEAEPFLRTYERGRFDGLAEGETFHDDDVLVTLCGVGKIKATLRTERLMQNHKLRRIVHVGTCTALGDALPIGSLVAATQVFEGDRIELAAPTYPRMPLSNPFTHVKEGTLVTQDHTVKEQSERSYWQRIADMSDMTGYAVAFVTATYGTPCHILKVVTGQLNIQDKNLRKTLTRSYETLGTYLSANMKKLQEL